MQLAAHLRGTDDYRALSLNLVEQRITRECDIPKQGIVRDRGLYKRNLCAEMRLTEPRPSIKPSLAEVGFAAEVTMKPGFVIELGATERAIAVEPDVDEICRCGEFGEPEVGAAMELAVLE